MVQARKKPVWNIVFLWVWQSVLVAKKLYLVVQYYYLALGVRSHPITERFIARLQTFLLPTFDCLTF